MRESAGRPLAGAFGATLAGDRFAAPLARVGVPALRVAAVAFPVLFMVIAATSYTIFGDPTTIGSDSSNYYAAGLRLNAGHPLYALSPGDRPVPLVPPYWSIPLLAPPPIAVAWRLPALLGDVSMQIWWLASIALVTATLVLAARRATPLALVGLIVLSPALGLTAVSANANAFLIPALAGVWLLRDRSPLAAGALVALAASVKLSPILLVAWFLLRPDPRGRLGVAGFLVAGLVIAMASLVGAGLASHVDYVGALRSTANGAPTPLSLPGLLAAAGAPGGLVSLSLPLLVAASIGGAVLLRRHDRWSFAVLAVGAALATPVVYFQTIALLAVALVPWLFPDRDTAPERAPEGGMAAYRGQ